MNIETKELIADLRALCVVTNNNPHIKVLADSRLITNSGKSLNALYNHNTLSLEQNKWNELFTCLLELVEYFTNSFIKEGKLKAPSVLNLIFWFNTGRKLFQFIKRIIQVTKKDK